MRLTDRFLILRNKLIYGKREVFDLNKPFHHEVLTRKRRRPINKLLVDPYETFKTKDTRISRLIIPIPQKDTAGFATFISGQGRLSCHAIYDTNRRVSCRFRLKSLDQLKRSIAENRPDVRDVDAILTSILHIILRGFDYQYLVTDLPETLLHKLDLNIPVYSVDQSITLTGVGTDPEYSLKLAILREIYDLPLIAMYPKILSTLPYGDSGLEPVKAFCEKSTGTGLILLWSHPALAGFIRSYLESNQIKACSMAIFQTMRLKR